MFSTSEEGMTSVERCESLGNKFATDGIRVIHVSTSSHAKRMKDDDSPVFILPDPKIKTSMSTKEWNETCLDLIVSIIESNNIGKFIFDGPYPYRGVLNVMDIYSEIQSIWRRPAYSPATNHEQIEKFSLIETDLLEDYQSNIQEITKSENEGAFHLLMGLGYEKRGGVAKRTPAVITQLKRLPRMQIILPEHLGITKSALGISTIIKWDCIATNENLNTLDAAIIPPEPFLIRKLADLQIPTIVVTSGNLPKSEIVKMRLFAQTCPFMILDDPDGEDLRLALGTLVSGTMQSEREMPIIN